MALLTASKSPKTRRKPGSTAPGSSVPSSFPDSTSLELIESLKRELSEAKASREATAQEIANLKAKLAEAENKAAQPIALSASQHSDSTKDNDSTNGTSSSFFGY